MKFERVFARANAWTFQIKPIKNLLIKYVGNGKGWVDPFSGKSELAQHANDLNPNTPADVHMLATDFVHSLEGEYEGVLFDPPYSYRQISEHYKKAGLPVTRLDTSYRFYGSVMNGIAPKIKQGGLAISFGWNSNGFGKKRGFKIIDGLIVAHGLHHNDTIVTVEEKL